MLLPFSEETTRSNTARVLDKNAHIPDWAVTEDFFSVARTPDELSIVCAQANVPSGIDCQRDWRCFKVESPFEFDLVSVMSSVAALLDEADIDMFVVATQDSDFLLVKGPDLEREVQILLQNGHHIET